MYSFSKYIKKHLLTFISIIISIIILDIILFVLVFQGIVNRLNHSSPGKLLSETVTALTDSDNSYDLDEEQKRILENLNIWCIVIDPEGAVVWNYDLPEEIPLSFSLVEISEFSRGYIREYPVFSEAIDDNNLLVLGYPQNSYIKITSNYLPYSTPRTLMIYAIGIFFLDILLLFLAYTFSKRQISKNINPIINSIDKLSQGHPVNIQTTGDLAEVGNSINTTSDILINKDTARANWITGVSHDIRTPLSIILGYADRIAHNNEASGQIREQADIICRQSLKIKGLIADLNLASQLDYDMQPLNTETFSVSKLLREIAADFINTNGEDKYILALEINTEYQYMMNGDKELLKRAVDNLLNNSMNHNPDGCKVSILLSQKSGHISIVISDDGIGVSQNKLDHIINVPHYLNSPKITVGLQHGMGLHLVKKIILSHGGEIEISSEKGKGFRVKIIF